MDPIALVISAEHASNARPPDFLDSGIPEEIFETHAAWDPGVREVASALAERLGAPLFLGRFTRLYVDLNRSPVSAECVPTKAFGVEVPKNRGLSPEAIAARIEAHHRTYWDGVRGAIQAAFSRGQPVLHVAVHSFVEVYDGKHRPVDLGVLIDPEAPLEKRLADRLAGAMAKSGLLILENEPYDGRADALTTALRKELGTARYAGVEIEINQRHLGRLPEIANIVEAGVRAALEGR
ncbi:MAG: N-formylglutamate amidohydrolase [Myxococcota bacterium]